MIFEKRLDQVSFSGNRENRENHKSESMVGLHHEPSQQSKCSVGLILSLVYSSHKIYLGIGKYESSHCQILREYCGNCFTNAMYVRTGTDNRGWLSMTNVRSLSGSCDSSSSTFHRWATFLEDAVYILPKSLC